MVNVLATLKYNRAMVDWSIDEDEEDKLVEVKSKFENSSKTADY
jgi:hypothetical protein